MLAWVATFVPNTHTSERVQAYFVVETALLHSQNQTMYFKSLYPIKTLPLQSHKQTVYT